MCDWHSGWRYCSLMLCLIISQISQTVGKLQQQERHPSETQVLNPNWTDYDLLRLPVAHHWWPSLLLLLLDSHARPWEDPVFTMSYMRVLGVYKVSLSKIMWWYDQSAILWYNISEMQDEYQGKDTDSIGVLRAHLDLDGRSLCFKWWPTSGVRPGCKSPEGKSFFALNLNICQDAGA